MLAEVCQKVQHDDAGWLRFVAAIESCLQHSLTLVTDLMPRGHSDGSMWTLQPMCAMCSVTRDSSTEACFSCGTTNQPVRERKLKVLGLRPYLNLEKVVGEEGLRKLRES